VFESCIMFKSGLGYCLDLPQSTLGLHVIFLDR
jgi:hypothetical protein